MHSGIAIICGVMTGLVRSMCVGEGVAAKVTPADYLISATIASAWKKSTVSSDELLIYNCTDAENNPLLWKKTFEIGKQYVLENAPYDSLVWYPSINFTSNYIWHKTSLLLFQLLPAILFDSFQVLSGKKPK